MINLSLNELKLIAQSRNISDYESKSKKDLIKALCEPKPKSKPKIRINKKQLKEIRKDLYELRHKSSKKEIDRYRKAFYDIKNYKHFSISEIKKVRKNLNKSKKSLVFIKLHGDVDSVDYDDLDYADDDDLADGAEYRRIGSIRRLFRSHRDYYKPIRTDDSFGGRRNNYIEYTSRRDRYEYLSPERHLDKIRSYLRDLINDHKPTTELNSNNDESGEWKFQLVMQKLYFC